MTNPFGWSQEQVDELIESMRADDMRENIADCVWVQNALREARMSEKSEVAKIVEQIIPEGHEVTNLNIWKADNGNFDAAIIKRGLNVVKTLHDMTLPEAKEAVELILLRMSPESKADDTSV